MSHELYIMVYSVSARTTQPINHTHASVLRKKRYYQNIVYVFTFRAPNREEESNFRLVCSIGFEILNNMYQVYCISRINVLSDHFPSRTGQQSQDAKAYWYECVNEIPPRGTWHVGTAVGPTPYCVVSHFGIHMCGNVSACTAEHPPFVQVPPSYCHVAHFTTYIHICMHYGNVRA